MGASPSVQQSNFRDDDNQLTCIGKIRLGTRFAVFSNHHDHCIIHNRCR